MQHRLLGWPTISNRMGHNANYPKASYPVKGLFGWLAKPIHYSLWPLVSLMAILRQSTDEAFLSVGVTLLLSL